MASVQGFAQLAEALQQLGWGCCDATIESDDDSLSPDCWFRRWLTGPRSGMTLNAVGHRQVQRLVTAGWTLRNEWPRSWSDTVTQWLGRRFFVGHDSLFSNDCRYHSLISSRIGRDGGRYPHWPLWIDGALRHVRRIGGRLLIAPDATLSAAVAQYAATAQLPATTVGCANTGDVTSWLKTLLAALAKIDAHCAQAGSELYLSPAVQAPSHPFAALPWQDRLAMALADRVMAMSIRKGGAVEKLAQLRLANPAFPPGTLFITLPQLGSPEAYKTSNPPASLTAASTQWLTRGAVGWIVADRSWRETGPLQHCRLARVGEPSLQQLAAPLPARWRRMAANDDWPYLVHCTRGTSGRQLEESEDCFRQRVWSQGEVRSRHPLETLAHICCEGRLRAAAGMTRTAEPCVSFSAVPLVPLLRRRIFRPHLSRWDWEPYGLVILRDSLRRLGAREVIYGTETDFEQLSERDRPLFQPSWRKQAQETWSDEREWRVLGDVALHSLPATSVRVFVRTECEARQFARYSPWPVLWVE